ncbi:hypothetical protein BC629DRAFT_1437794 [Irpex lacteus]|nr:hypothetical protein BC629DRAFT_1437794 [Irpex lacteus]
MEGTERTGQSEVGRGRITSAGRGLDVGAPGITTCRFRCHPSPSFTVATEQQIALTLPLEAEALQVGLRKHEEYYAWTSRKSTVKQHLLMSHNIEHPTEYDWIDRTTNVRVADPVFIVWRKKGEKSLQDHTIYPNRVQIRATTIVSDAKFRG